jgi:tripartite-type tricarboxylate transporter receptor subunit TctC
MDKTNAARRSMLALAVGTACSLVALPGFAQSVYPETDKPIKIVVGFAPGGFTDVLARLIAQKLGTALGTTVIVDNKPGATGTIGADLVAKAKPDGYTILMGHFASNSVAPALFPKLPYNVLRDFTPITYVATTPVLLVVNPAVPARDVKTFIEYARKNPGQLSFASSGNGTAQHLAAAQFMYATKIQMVHVPYKGSAAAMTDLLGGQVQLNFESPPNALPHIRTGKLNALAVTSLKRTPLLPDVPTLDEAGLPKFEMSQWFGILGPANLPPAITARLNKEINALLRAPDVVEKIAEQGGEIKGGTPEQFSAFLARDVVKWAELVKSADIKAD